MASGGSTEGSEHGASRQITLHSSIYGLVAQLDLAQITHGFCGGCYNARAFGCSRDPKPMHYVCLTGKWFLELD